MHHDICPCRCRLGLRIKKFTKTGNHSSDLGPVITIISQLNIHRGQLRWLDWIFWGGYLPSLSINYVAMSKDMEKRLPQLHYIKMKISYDLGFIAIGVAMAM